MAGRYGDRDYAQLTKRAFLFGVLLFVVGELGEYLLSSFGGPVPPWEHALLIDAAILGVIIALLSPFVFGIILPLTE